MGIKNQKYLKFIRGLSCGICHKPGEPHHIRRSYWGAGMGLKPHDHVAVSRCRDCHNALTEDDIEREIIDNLIAFIEMEK